MPKKPKIVTKWEDGDMKVYLNNGLDRDQPIAVIMYGDSIHLTEWAIGHLASETVARLVKHLSVGLDNQSKTGRL